MNMLGKKAIAIWIAVAAIVSVGSFAIAVQPVSDEKIHLQDVDGKIHTNVPVAASRAFSPLPIEFDAETEVTSVTGGTVGSTMQTTQKVIQNFVLDTSEDVTATFTLDNRSEDAQIFLIKAGAPSNVIIDFESGTGVTVLGEVGHNEWLASIAAAQSNGTVTMEVSATDAGMYPIVVELLRVG